jgi:SHS family lactate transporter-like MFS transporter
MEIAGRFRRLTPPQKNTFVACFLGWSLDAFDFFILIFCISALATHFQTKVSAITEAIFLTLAMRPVGAFLFGLMADRFGRRPTLMINVAAFTLFEVASAFAPTLTVFLVIRALFGIGMGGEWGVGAALAFETLPAQGRGFFSGLLQEGYVVGYLAAALAYGILFPIVGWRGMFAIGALPAAVVLYLLSKTEESPAWLHRRVDQRTDRSLGRDIASHAGLFFFLVVLMFAFNSFSHGTQDLYPTFLEKNLELSARMVSVIAILSSIGALLGGILFGTVSERMGRRRAIVIAAMLAIPMIPLWAFSRTVPWLAAGGFFMQFMVQGAWGVIPAHLNELSPPSVRGTLPGFAYQLGNLLSSRNAVIQARVAEMRYAGSFPPVLAWTVVIVATLVAIVTTSGRERRGADLSNSA